ncbi:hypothetical protein [Lentzea sp. HUAS12]|uniref:hypothetical protein n=1 Tax=Lentzea sp. HUAS12 TaxID=2951806 RepID=UPI00209DF9B2|nr:hypothetical protein [Lentzea sp. HUAS12]USX56154.1 hypothetical protein ND450_19265 [Lentzea sp. HUAS12]
MSRNRSGCGGCALAFLALFFWLPLALVLVSPAIALRTAVDGVPEQVFHPREWLWGAAFSVPLSVLVVRSVFRRDGRVRGAPPGKRWAGLLAHGLVLLAATNLVAYQKNAPGEYVVQNSDLPFVGTASLTAVAVLVVMALWDRRARRVTVEEVREAAAQADRALKRVHAENAKVHRQAEQVQARLVKLQARAPVRNRRGEVEFHSLRVFHRESYQCADTAHLAYTSAQTSLRTMSPLVRRARSAALQLTVSRRARAEMRAAATHLATSCGELRAQVDHGLGMVRDLNANTSELKHEIRDNCGAQGRRWFEELEERIEQAREERRTSRTR